MSVRNTPLTPGSMFVDLYELTMADVYLHEGIHDKVATFSLYFRGYPRNRSYYLATGIDTALDYLENLSIDPDDVDRLRELGKLSDELLKHIDGMRFTGSVRAVREGTIVFESEPVLEVTAPIIEAQFVEAALLNTITTSTLFATKAARIVQAARGKPVIDMSARRTHGSAAALLAARAAYLAGFQASSLLEADRLGVPVAGTMAHSYVQAMPDELTAFRKYVSRYPIGATLLVDTYDTTQGIRNAITVAHELNATSGNLRAIRIDSGDFMHWARLARNMLDDAGLQEVEIVASGGLDEYKIDELESQGAPIDAYGVGTKFGTSADAPYIESVYKLVEFDGRPVYKRSEGKSTLPYAKQVHRTFGSDGMMQHDMITRFNESTDSPNSSEPLLSESMRHGVRDRSAESISTVRANVESSLARLPARYRELRNPDEYPVHISDSLKVT